MEDLFVLFTLLKSEVKVQKKIKCVTTCKDKILEGIKDGYSAQLADAYILDDVKGEYIGQKCKVADGIYEWREEVGEEELSCAWVKIG